MLGALIYCIVTVTFKGNQTVTGLALTIFGTGFAGMLGKSMSGVSLPQPVLDTFAAYDVPGLSKIPILGEAFFQQSIYVQIAPILAVLIYFFIKKTRIGLNMRAVGENPAAADASGINVNRYKYLSLLAGGFFLLGLGRQGRALGGQGCSGGLQLLLPGHLGPQLWKALGCIVISYHPGLLSRESKPPVEPVV